MSRMFTTIAYKESVKSEGGGKIVSFTVLRMDKPQKSLQSKPALMPQKFIKIINYERAKMKMFWA